MKRTTTFNLSYLLFAVFGVLLLHNLWVTMQTVAPIPYSDFQKQLKDKKVKEVVITAQELGHVAYDRDRQGMHAVPTRLRS